MSRWIKGWFWPLTVFLLCALAVATYYMLLLWVGASDKSDEEQAHRLYDQVQAGMAMEQVHALFGDPPPPLQGQKWPDEARNYPAVRAWYVHPKFGIEMHVPIWHVWVPYRQGRVVAKELVFHPSGCLPSNSLRGLLLRARRQLAKWRGQDPRTIYFGD